MADEILDAIEAAATSPAKAQADGQGVEAHPIPDQIAAHKYKAQQTAMKKKNRGLRFNKLVPPGSA